MSRSSLLLILLFRSAYSTLLGWVESPGYPGGYLPHASLNWTRCAPKGHTLSIRLIHLDLEDSHNCENDAVEVFSDKMAISVLCGKKDFEELQVSVNPLLHSSPGGCLSLSFRSDFSNTRKHTGFRGFYSVQDFDECEDDTENGCTQFCHNFIGGYQCTCRHGYYLDTDKHTCTVSCTEDLSGLTQGDISTPSWPGPYAENANCEYTLSVEPHLQLELHFSEVFDVEQSLDGQCTDALRIMTHSGSLGPFCGLTPPPSPLLTHSHQVKIHFTSDGAGNNKGFSLHFQTTDKVCPAAVTSHSTVTPLETEYHQGQRVTVTCDLGHVVKTQGTQTEYVTACQSTGEWAPNYSCEPVDCGFPNIPRNGILQLVDSDNAHTQYEAQIQFRCSSKYYTLEGDDTYTCSATGEWVSVAGESKMPKCTPVCGMREQHRANTGRILGGQDANLGEIPWNLLIKEPNRGGASLINDQWAVTAAHVVENVEETSLTLYGGLVDGRTTSNPQSNVVAINSEKIIIHPGYSRVIPSTGRTNFDNDIALIRLASRVNFGPNLIPICLPEANTHVVENMLGTVSGWGLSDVIDNQGKARLVVARMLQYAHIGVSPITKCQVTPVHGPSKRQMTFTENMFCAGADGRDSCQKDSGGPFVVPMLSADAGPYYLAGIVSWGPPCNKRLFKGYYTKVENYVEWIKKTIDETGNP